MTKDLAAQIAIIEGIRRAIAACAHHKAPSRLKLAIQKELPDATVYIGKQSYDRERTEVSVWGKGLPHGERLSVSTSSKHPDTREPWTWQESLLRALDVADPTDGIEFRAAEEKLVPELERLNAIVADARKQAVKLTSKTPTPKSAKVRADRVFWGKASYELQGRFPLLFKDP